MGVQPYAIDHMQLEQFHIAQAQNVVNGGGDQQQRMQTVPSPHAPSSAYVPSPGPTEASVVPNISSPMAGLSVSSHNILHAIPIPIHFFNPINQAGQPQVAANIQMQTAQFGTPQAGPYSRGTAWNMHRN